MQKQSLIKTILVAALSLSPMLVPPAAYGASATMSINPAAGSYTVGTPFSVDLVIDGKGEAFNAAKATVSVSAALQISDVFMGDCNFSFITTPTITNPSFVGALLGSSSQQCTVYTLTLIPAVLGSGTVTLSEASIKKYGNAAEILQSVQNGTYTLTGSSSQQSTTTPQSSNQSLNQTASTVPESDPGLVTVVVKTVDSENKPIAGATVLLNPSDSSAPPEATTDESGTAQITNVPPGVHTIEVQDNKKVIASKIVNVSGNEPLMYLGIKQQKEAVNWLGLTVIIVTVLAAVGFVILYFHELLFQLLQRVFKKA